MDMRTQTPLLFLFVFLLSATGSRAQQPTMVVRDFEYVQGEEVASEFGGTAATKFLATTDTVRQYFARALAEAIRQRWGVAVPVNDLYVRGVPMFSSEPKFKTEVRDREKGKWYLFFQIYDQGKKGYGSMDSGYLNTVFRIQCRILDGGSDSVLFNRKLLVKLVRRPIADSLAIPSRLGIYPLEYRKVADSVACWMFQAIPGPKRKTSCCAPPAFTWKTWCTGNRYRSWNIGMKGGNCSSIPIP